jgi:hypothetical protein
MPNHLTPPESLGDEYKRRLMPKLRFCERMKVVDIIFGSNLFCLFMPSSKHPVG